MSMKKFVLRFAVAAAAITIAAGLAAADTTAKRKKSFLQQLFGVTGERTPANRQKNGRKWLWGSKDEVRIIRGELSDLDAEVSYRQNLQDDDPEGEPGLGMGNLNYVPDKHVALAEPQATGTRPAGEAEAAIFDALGDSELGVRVLPEEKKAILQLYREHGYRPLWLDNGRLAGRALGVLKVLGAAAEDGMNAENYRPPALSSFDAAGSLGSADGASLARLDLGLTAMALKYARHASGGQFDPRRLSRYNDVTPAPVSIGKALKVLAWSPFPDAYLKSLQPSHPAYAAMKAALADLRKSQGDEPPVLIEDGQRVKTGQKDARIVALRQRLEELGYSLAAAEEPEVLDDSVAESLMAYQKSAGIKATGNLDAATVNALNQRNVARDIAKLADNMERMRWLPKDLGRKYVFVNQAAFEVQVIDGSKEVWRSRVIVGKPNTQTAVFHDEIEMVVFNPSWGVPPSIIANEYLPKLRRDPSYLDRIGFKVTNANGKLVSSSSVDWWAYGNRVPYGIQQPPGRKNALGELKFLFPNSHNIYMHDTPNRELFANDVRTFSHGCVRVQNPREFATVLLGWDRAKVDANTDSKKSQTVRLPGKVPIHITYFTAWPDETGKIQYYNDIYERDTTLERAASVVLVAQR